jgi:dTDP-glucose 4,6-dehydratase
MATTVLVTGGAGFIGSNFVRHLLQTDDSVSIITLDLLTYAGSLSNLAQLPVPDRHTMVEGDIADGPLVRDLLTSHEIDTNRPFRGREPRRSLHRRTGRLHPDEHRRHVHLARGRSRGVARKIRPMPLRPCLDGRGLRLARRVGSPLFRDNSLRTQLTLRGLQGLGGPPGAALLRTYGFPAVTTNCSNNYGPYQYPEKLIPLMIINALTGKPLPIYGDGRQIRDWLYVEDHCEAICQVLARGRLGTDLQYRRAERTAKSRDRAYDLRSYWTSCVRYRPGKLSRADHACHRPAGHDRRYAIDASKIQTRTWLVASRVVRHGIRKTITWYLENEDWVNEVMSENYEEWMALNYADRREITST